MRILKKLILFQFIYILASTSVFAAEISFDVNVIARNDQVTVEIYNTGKDDALNVSLRVELDGRVVEVPLSRRIKGQTRLTHTVTIPLPDKPGSYPLHTTIYYFNDNQQLSTLNVGYFNHRSRAQLDAIANLEDIYIRDRTEVHIEYDIRYHFSLIIPDEILIERTIDSQTGRTYVLKNARPMFRSNYQIYGVLETDATADEKASVIYTARLQTQKPISHKSIFQKDSNILFGALGLLLSMILYRGIGGNKFEIDFDRKTSGIIQPAFIISIISGAGLIINEYRSLPKFITLYSTTILHALPLILFVFIFASINKRKKKDFNESSIAVTRWAFSVFIISCIFYTFRTAHVIPDIFLGYVTQVSIWIGETLSFLTLKIIDAHAAANFISRALRTILDWLYFQGNDYDYFIQYIADPLYIYMLIGNLYVLKRFIKPVPDKDKYWHLMMTFFSFIPSQESRKQKIHWSKFSKIAVLTLCVKMFYVPLLTSWTINNIFHQRNLIHSFEFTFENLNMFLVALLILIDVTIFAAGYLVELPQLKNQIKSVEPTILGWVVCLWCYPPFNQFSFYLFDSPLNDHWTPAHSGVKSAALVGVTISWAVYTWATIALGWRASNLTNRGIVDTGPYAYIRHPAYASKVFLWALEAYILGIKNFFLIVALLVVYALRAWTEERHLSQDPDYIEYKKIVRYRFIPGVF
jgi:protein-S-isoprenylcysteine O-methyltransferase Ste14